MLSFLLTFLAIDYSEISCDDSDIQSNDSFDFCIYNKQENETFIIISRFINPSGNFVVPSTLPYGGKNLPVRALIKQENENSSQIICDSITIQENIEYIGSYFFYKSNFKTIKFPTTLQEIDDFCFSNSFIQQLEIPIGSTLMRVGGFAFENCFNLTEFDASQTKINEIGDAAFYNCTSLSVVWIPSDCRYTGVDAFSHTAVYELSLYGKVGDLQSCPNLLRLAIFGIKNHESFNIKIANCENLAKLDFFSCNYTLATENLISLTEIQIDNSTINYRENTGQYSNVLHEIELVAYSFLNVSEIVLEMFINLKSVKSDSTSYVNAIYTDSFIDLPNMQFQCNVKEVIQTRAFNNVGIFEITLTAKKIESYAFYQCNNLKYVRISSEVEELCEHFIEDCKNFESLEFLDINNTDNLLTFAPNLFWKITTFNLNSKLPARLQVISSRSFCDCTGLTGSLTLPKSLKIIGDSAFEGCYNLKGFLCFECNELEKIGNSAFLGCINLCGSLELPESLTEIGEYCFTNCAFQGPLIIPKNVIVIKKHAFSMCKSFTGSLTIGKNVEVIEEYAFADCTELNGQLNIYSTKIREIQNNAFYRCYQLKGNLLTLENCQNLQMIGDFAFYQCSSLTNALKLPNSVNYIGDSDFAYCYGITDELIIPQNILYIGANASFEYTKITRISFQKSLNKDLNIEPKAFGNMRISCLSNVPSVCSIKNSSNLIGYDKKGDSRCYDSSEFDSLTLFFNAQESCSSRETAKVFEWIFIIIFLIIILIIFIFIFK